MKEGDKRLTGVKTAPLHKKTYYYHHDSQLSSHDKLVLTRLGHKDGMYHLEISISDATDYERLIYIILQTFRGLIYESVA